MTVTSGDVLGGRYRVGRVLGCGGAATVHAAQDLSLGREVAVKIPRAGTPADSPSGMRFEDEARAVARLSHPNVVRIFDLGVHEGSPFVVMERLAGRTLADEITDGPLGGQRVRAIGRQLLGAVEVAHGAGVVHRGIEPGNVLLAVDGSVRLGDFEPGATTGARPRVRPPESRRPSSGTSSRWPACSTRR